MKLWPLVPVLILSLFLSTATACNPLGGGDEEPRENKVEVTRGDLSLEVSGSGNLELTNEKKQTFAISGRIEEIYLEEGEEVRKGDILARLETDTLELALAEARSRQSQIYGNLSQAKMSRTQAQAANGQAEISQAQAQTGFLQAQAALSQAQAARSQALLVLEPAEDNLKDAEDFLEEILKFFHKDRQIAKDAQTAFDRATLQYESAQAQLDAAESQIEAADSQFEVV